MKLFEKKIKAVKQFQKRTDEIVLDAIEEQKHIVFAMNFHDQLDQDGVNSDNVQLQSYNPYSPAYLKRKQQQRKYRGYVDLRQEGNFAQSGKLNRRPKEIEIDNTDFKKDYLVGMYGEEILGLTDDNLEIMKEEFVQPKLVEELRKAVES